MKQIPLFLALVMLLLVSCSKDDNLNVNGGETIKARFSLSTAEPTIEGTSTRSTDTLTVNDSKVQNLWMLQYVNGTLASKDYLATVNLANFELDLTPNATGAKSNIYFVANVGPNAFTTAPTTESAYMAKTQAVTSEAASLLLAGTAEKLIPMSGRLQNVEVKIGGSIQSSVLYRMLARIDYTYSIDPALTSSFIIKKIRVSGVPMVMQYDSVQTAVYPANGLTTQSFTYEVADQALTGSPKTFSFYVPGNRRGVGSNTALVNDKLKTGVAGATCIELIGYTIGANGGDEIAYKIYPGADQYNDYNINRNTIYKITTNLTGSVSPAMDGRFVKSDKANCYIVAPGGSVSIPVKRANSSDLGIQIPDVRKDWTASIYWQTAAGLVTVSADAADMALGRFTVTAPSATTKGNAVVAVKDGSGNILWSWHIWVTDYNPATENESQNSLVWMSRNLGATAVADTVAQTTFATSGGLLYQWGRKDPFPGSDGLTTGAAAALPIYDATGTLMTNTSLTWPTDGTPTATGSTGDVVKYATVGATAGTQIPFASQLAYSVKYPLLHLVNWAGSTATASASASVIGGQSSWGGMYNEVKSVYDPCPVGWRVPSYYKASTTATSPWSTWSTVRSFKTSAYAGLKYNGVGTYYYPAAGNRYPSSGALSAVGANGYYWGASSSGTAGCSLYFSSGYVLPSNNSSRAFGYGVRCVQEW